MPFGVLLLPVLVLLAASCSRREIGETLFLGDEFVLAEDIPYGDGSRRVLDVYSARGASDAALRPVVVFLYGGRWQDGSKREYRLMGDQFVRRGFVTVVPDYRLHPTVDFPAWVDDAAESIAWTRDEVRRWGGDPDRIFVIGHSAGAHTAALLAVDPGYLDAVGVPEGSIRGYVVMAGPVDTVWTDRDVQILMGPEEGWPATYPATHIDANEAPILLLHGADDETVDPANSTRFAERVRAAGACARAVVYRGVDHVEVVVALSVPRLDIAPVMDDVVAFLRDPLGICRAGAPDAPD